MATYAGSSLKRIEDPQLVQGKGSFVDDIALPGMLHAVVLRSPHAHARIVSMDASLARGMPGVAAVLTSHDIEGKLSDVPPQRNNQYPDMKMPDHPILARGKVCYVGQPVAIVVAQDRYLARDAAEMVVVEYKPLPPVMDAVEATQPTSPPIHQELGSNVALRMQVGKGDLDASFKEAHRIVRGQFQVPRLSHAPMECRAAIARYDSGDRTLTLWSSTQVPHKIKSRLGPLLNRPDVHFRVIAPDVGGGFGQKVEIWPEEVALCHLSMLLEKPIKWAEERWENMLAYQARGFYGDVEAAVANDGVFLGMRFRMVADMGGYFLTSTTGPANNAIRRVAGPYHIPNMDVEVICVTTNKPPTGPYRGAGGPEGAFFMERIVDLVAQELELDPAEVRRRNLLTEDSFPYTTATGLIYDSGRYQIAFDRAMELGDYFKFRRMQRDRRPEDPLIGIGIASVVKASGGSNENRDSSALIQVDPSGQVRVHTDISPHGQGTETSFSQIVADELGISPDNVQILHGDSDLSAIGIGTYASRGLTVGGSAMYLGLQDARRKMAEIGGHLLKCSSEDVVFQNGKVFNGQDPEHAMSFDELAASAYQRHRLPRGMEPGLEFRSDFSLPHNPYAFGAHVAVVQIDPATGEISILRYAAVHDCGRVINPRLMEGQMQGGLAQGLGQALMEAIGYSDEGQPLTGTFMDYSLPTAEDIPRFESDMLHTPSPLNPLGVKGGGELPTVASPVALANALADAFSGASMLSLDAPLTPEKVWRAFAGISL